MHDFSMITISNNLSAGLFQPNKSDERIMDWVLGGRDISANYNLVAIVVNSPYKGLIG
jgi:hypothetical protein